MLYQVFELTSSFLLFLFLLLVFQFTKVNSASRDRLELNTIELRKLRLKNIVDWIREQQDLDAFLFEYF